MILDRVTITGADDTTDPKALVALSARFPWVEWGILLSLSAEGRPRFPSAAWIHRLFSACSGRAWPELSGHLCGRWVRDLCRGRLSVMEDRPGLLRGFNRVQLNFHAITHTIELEPFAAALHAIGRGAYIFQIDGANDAAVDMALSRGVPAFPLFDLSGGAGVLPAAWPAHVGSYCGYAGGLSPENVTAQLERIKEVARGECRVWIDVETHVRTPDDRALDLDRVERFLLACQAFGVHHPAAA